MRRPLGIATGCLSVLLLAAFPLWADPAEEWIDIHDGGDNYVDEGTVALADPDGHLVVGGSSNDGVFASDMYFYKLHRLTHAVIWSQRVPAFDDSDMVVSQMVWDGYGDILVGGYIAGCVG
ncbi:MAG: hypothetical protein ABIF77_14240 [bacterium]